MTQERIIKSLLVLKGITMTDVARRNGWSPSYISHTIAGRKKQKKPRQAIARAIGKKVNELWPDAA